MPKRMKSERRHPGDSAITPSQIITRYSVEAWVEGFPFPDYVYILGFGSRINEHGPREREVFSRHSHDTPESASLGIYVGPWFTTRSYTCETRDDCASYILRNWELAVDGPPSRISLTVIAKTGSRRNAGENEKCFSERNRKCAKMGFMNLVATRPWGKVCIFYLEEVALHHCGRGVNMGLVLRSVKKGNFTSSPISILAGFFDLTGASP
ncbi:uncharacterized protein MCYG_06531 [Microsporum canis CBS 113480]|uniref:Uncharacterized protein n=1 Tax=Arthroderma otae (strain ATCC MYA-4605 / CBS 113480) TaxID=554155 RepID=C5FUX8_ARTOC|nr:uncharacterized protein MCYG_06531 [Microsporum canis CBS 113480]EEQ33712.1 predicted protein [Microsporum canis CBS 113480]